MNRLKTGKDSRMFGNEVNLCVAQSEQTLRCSFRRNYMKITKQQLRRIIKEHLGGGPIGVIVQTYRDPRSTSTDEYQQALRAVGENASDGMDEW